MSTAPIDADEERKSGRRATSEFVPLKGSSSLKRLRDRVETAAHELKRLREENKALSDRLEQLELNPSVSDEGTLLTFEEDPELLRRKIETFIEAIDRYLQEERRSD